MINQDIFTNPEYIKENKEKGHVISLGYDTKEDALKNNNESPYKFLLDGNWKFYHQMGMDKRRLQHGTNGVLEKDEWVFLNQDIPVLVAASVS